MIVSCVWSFSAERPFEPDGVPPLPPGTSEPPCPNQAGDPPEHDPEDGPQQLH